MGLRRRALLALSGAVGLAGCSAPQAETGSNEPQQNSDLAKQERTPPQFNDEGELISPVNNQLVHTKESRTESETITVEVPSDFNTVAAAVDEIKEIRTPPGVIFEIVIESGHIFRETVYLEQQDFRHVTVTSEDEKVPVDADAVARGDRNRLFFGLRNTVLPKIDCLFDGEGATTIRGLFAGRNSGAYLTPGSGFEAMERGIELSGPGFIAGEHGVTDIIARNMSERGVSIINGDFYLRGSDISNCDDFGIRCGEFAHGSIRGANVAGSRIGIRSTRFNFITAFEADLSGGEQGISITGGSHVELVNADISGGSATNEIEISSGSIVQAHNCTTSNGTPSVDDVNVDGFNEVHSEGIVFA